MPLTLVIQPRDGEALRTRVVPGRNRITVRVGDTFRIIDDATGKTPAGVKVRQLDTSLIVEGLDPAATDAPVVEFAEFYTLCSPATPCQLLLDSGTSAAPVSITPGTAPIGALTDGGYVLYDPAYSAPAAPVADNSVGLRYGLYGLGGLAVVGLAAGGGGGGGGSGGPVANNGNQPAPDGTLKLVSSDYNVRKPVISGEGQPGDQITVRIDVNGDAVVDVTYVTTVGDDFLWSINLATATPLSGSLPAEGLGDATTLAVASNGQNGANSLAPITVRFDNVAPGPAKIDPVTGDGLIVGPEKTAGVTVTGSAEAGSLVQLEWAGQTASARTDAAGRWSATFAPATVAADGASTITAVVLDAAGNQSTSVATAVTVDTRPALFNLSSIAGDGIVAIADGNAFQFTGTAQAGTQIAVRWNGIDHAATTGADGQWAVAYTGTEIPTVNATPIAYSITATNLLGNVSTVGGSVLVDRVAPAAPTIATVAGDNQVSQAERVGGVTVTGTAVAGEQVAVTWGTTARNATADAAGSWSVTFGAGELPTVGSPGGNTTINAVATDAAGNASPAAAQVVYVVQPFAPPTVNPVAGNDVVSAAERNGGVILSGTVATGSPGVTVTWGGWNGAATIIGGQWQVAVPAGQVPGDGNTSVVAAITGFPGVATARAVTVDATAPGAPAIAAVGGDNLISVADRAGPIAVTGTAEAGATVLVNWGGATASTTAAGDGSWQVAFSPAQIPATGSGASTVAVTATATDAAGNTGATASTAVTIIAPFAAPAIAATETDDIVNAAEQRDGVVIRGTAPAGAPGVQVDWGSFSGVAAVSGTSWEITVPPGRVPGEGAHTVVATITGEAGGAASGRSVTVDTVAPTAPTVLAVTGDDVISAAENLIGFAITGTAEAGARITLTGGTLALTTTADGAGNWSIGSVSRLPTGSLTLSALTTDAAGNIGEATTRTIDVQSAGVAYQSPTLDDPLRDLLA